MTTQEMALLSLIIIFVAAFFDILDQILNKKTNRNAGAWIKDKNGHYKKYKF